MQGTAPALFAEEEARRRAEGKSVFVEPRPPPLDTPGKKTISHDKPEAVSDSADSSSRHGGDKVQDIAAEALGEARPGTPHGEDVALAPTPASLAIKSGTAEVHGSPSTRDTLLTSLLTTVENALPTLKSLAAELEREGAANANVALVTEGRTLQLVVTPTAVQFSVEVRELSNADAQRSLARVFREMLVGTMKVATDPRTLGTLTLLVSALALYLEH